MTTYHLFDDDALTLPYADDDGDLTLGTEFIVNEQCWLTQFRWYRPTNENTGSVREGSLYKVVDIISGDLLVGPIPLVTPAQGQWASTDLPAPYELSPGRYKVAIRHRAGRYPAQLNWFGGSSQVRGPVTVPSAFDATFNRQGTYVYNSGGYPTEAFQSASYFSDVTISDTNPSVATGITLKTRESGVWVTHTADPKVFIDGLWIPASPKRYESGSWIGL